NLLRLEQQQPIILILLHYCCLPLVRLVVIIRGKIHWGIQSGGISIAEFHFILSHHTHAVSGCVAMT
ncbi:hypothetical protein ACHAXM_005352, partial [Skeletonema potamos]